MLVIFIMVMYTLLNVCIALELHCWLKNFSGVFNKKPLKILIFTLYAVMALLMIIAFFIPSGYEVKKYITRTANYFNGVFLNTLLILGSAHIIAFFVKLFKLVPWKYFRKGKPKAVSGAICFVAIIAMSVYGCLNANYIRTTEYDVTVDKPGDDMKIILVSDIHLGYNWGYRNIEDMVEKINALNPDLVCFAGDIFDNDYDAIDNPQKISQALSSIKSTYGSYACWGNHAIKEKLLGGFTVDWKSEKKQDQRMKDFVKNAGIKLLEDETVVIDNKFVLLGRLDYEKPGTENGARKAIDEFVFDKTKPVIVIDHEPRELQEIADAGADIDLCGHTHNGQIFPMTLAMKFIWENPAGCIQKNGVNGNTMYNIVTSGIGVYGPFMRTGCKSEIVEINVHFSEK